MSGFIRHIMNRHLDPGLAVQPRLPGKFESFNFSRESSPAELNITREAVHQAIDAPGSGKTSNEALEKQQRPQMTGKAGDSSGKERSNDPGKRNSEIQEFANRKVIPSGGNDERTNIPDPFEKSGIPQNVILQAGGRVDPGIMPAPEHGEISPEGDNSLPGKFVPGYSSNSVHPDPVTGLKPQAQISINGYLNSNAPAIFAGRSEMRDIPPSSPKGFSFMKEQQETTPVIKVSIGRIEVRAIADSKPVRMSPTGYQKPKMTLDDYLNKRNKGEK